MEMILGNLKCSPGEKIRGYWEINEGCQIPVTLINGKRGGKTAVICAGVHACEYVGIEAAMQIAAEILPHDIAGRIIVIHMANPTGFYKKMPGVVPEDGINLNRAFPGDMDGTLSQRIAASFVEYVYPQADFFLDLHCGDLQEDVMPFVYFSGVSAPEISKISSEAANFLSVEYRVKSSARTGAYSCAALHGIPALLMERGGRGSWSLEEVKEYKKNIEEILRWMGIVSGKIEKNKNQMEITQASYPEAPMKGVWHHHYLPGETFEEGALLGEIKDPFGDVLYSLNAEFSGVVLYETIALAVERDDPLVSYGKL